MMAYSVASNTARVLVPTAGQAVPGSVAGDGRDHLRSRTSDKRAFLLSVWQSRAGSRTQVGLDGQKPDFCSPNR